MTGVLRSRRRLLRSAVLVAIVAVTIGFLWRGERMNVDRGAAGTAILKVGDQRGGAQALLMAAGELKDVPYRIEWALFPAASPLLEALSAGAVDIGGLSGPPFAFAYASGAPIKVIHAYRPSKARTGHSAAIIVRKDSPLRGIADLKGRKVATMRGSAGQDTVLLLLEKAGLRASDVEWIYLSNGEAKAALGAGSVDAWSTWGSYVGIAVKDGDRILADRSGFPSGISFYAASDSAISTKHALLADFVRRLTRARDWAREHPREFAAVLARETGIPLTVALYSIESYLGSAVPIDRKVVDEQVQIFERFKRAGIIPAVPDVRSGYSPAFNDAVKAAAR